MTQSTETDSFLWYNVDQWGQYGLAVPNPSNDFASQNNTIRELVSLTGRGLQAVMSHVDARLRTPPSINTIRRVAGLCKRVRDILAARAVPASELNLETTHSNPAPEDFIVYPTPYFLVESPHLKNWAYYAFTAITEAMQTTDNLRPVEISEVFAANYGKWFNRIYQTLAVELLQVPLETARSPGFTLGEAEFTKYNPASFYTSTEMIDTVVDMRTVLTEDTLLPLTRGIPVSKLPLLARWPNGLTTAQNQSGSAGQSGTSGTPTTGTAFFNPTL